MKTSTKQSARTAGREVRQATPLHVFAWDGTLVREAREKVPSKLRDGEKMTQGEVAAALRVTPEAVRRWEMSLEKRIAVVKGESPTNIASPSAEKIGLLAALLNVTPSEFYRRVPVTSAAR